MAKSAQTETLDFKIRLARPEEVNLLAELQLAAFKPEDNIPVMIGRRFVRAKYRWLVTNPKTFALVAAAGDEIVGLVAITEFAFTKPMFKACLPELLQSIALKPSLLFKRRLWQRFFQGERITNRLGRQITAYPGVAQLPIVVIKKEFRSRGIFPALIAEALNISRKRGSRAVRAGVYKGNKASRRAFEKVGWKEVPELETTEMVFYMAYLDPSLAPELGIADAAPREQGGTK